MNLLNQLHGYFTNKATVDNMDSKEMLHKKHYKKSNKMRRDDDRYKKFVGNRTEGQGFADKRKKKIKHEYLRMLSKEKKKASSSQYHLNDKSGLSTSNDFRQTYNYERKESPNKGGKSKSSRQFNEDPDMSRFVETSLEPEEEEGAVGEIRFNRQAPEKSFNRTQDSRKGFRKQQYRDYSQDSSNIFSKAVDEAKTKRREVQRHREQKQKEREERQKALEQYRKKKKDNYFKFHCKKTHKGQPVMKYQMEFLLQKIMDRRERDKKL